jgi:HKD family nuclease
MRDDILKAISKERNVTDVIILTHNIDYIFIQTVILKYLKKCGNPSLTIFADASCAQESFDNQKLVISGLGQRYRVVPVYLKKSYDRFHPKAVLLSGEKKASLYVGSGNLTFGGWRQNAEIWNRYDTGVDGTGVMHAFKNYLDGILNRLPKMPYIEKAIADAYDTKTKIWTNSLDEPTGLLGRINTKKSLLKQMREHVEPGCQKLIVQSPYFDSQGKTIKQLNELFSPQRIEIMAQSKYSELTEEIIENLPPNSAVISTDFIHDTSNGSKKAFVHAKFYAFQYSDKVVVFSGSANCSQAALAMDGTILGNAELMNIRTMGNDEFQERFLNEFKMVEDPFEPMQVINMEEDSEQDEKHTVAQVISAQYEYKRLRIVYRVSEGYEVIGCKIGEEEYIAAPLETSLLIVDNPNVDHGDYLCLLVRNIQSNKTICTKEIWVDHESELSTSAKTRSLNDFIQTNSDQTLDHEKWGELIKIFNEHLSYTPKKTETQALDRESKHRTKRVTFNANDVFVDSYSFQPVSHILNNKHDLSIYALLSQYLGSSKVGKEEDDEVLSLTQEEIEQQLEEDTIEVDGKTTIKEKPELNENDRNKLNRLFKALIEAFTNADVIENRPIKMLFDDLKVASIILRMGLKEHWISEEEYFDATYILWTELFFSSEKDKNHGYIDIKMQNEDVDIEELLSPELSATMLAWLFAVEPSNSLKYIRLVLSAILVHAKYNWIFMGSDKAEEINKELNKALGAIGGEEIIQKTIQGHEKLWKLILKTGDAFFELIEKLNNYQIKDFKDLIPDTDVEKGDLLWQGNDGFYIVKSKYKRIKNNKNCAKRADVTSINSKKEDKKFCVDFTVPIQGLFEVDPDFISKDSQKLIVDFIDTYLLSISDIDDALIDG